MTELTSRDSDGHFTAVIETALRDAEAAMMYARGNTFQQIGDRFGVTKQAAHKMRARALDAAGKEQRERARGIELTKLDMREQVLLEVLSRRHVVVNNGHVVSLDGEPLDDDGIVIQTVDALGRVAQERAKVLGLYAPSRSTVTVVTEDVIDAEIRRWSETLNALSDADV